MNENPKILLVGTGAVGSYFTGRIQQAGAHVSAVCRSDYDIVKKQGIFVKSHTGNFLFKPEETVRHVSESVMEPDIIIVATKVLPEIDVPNLIRKKVSSGVSIFLLQNGIDIEQAAAAAFPENEIISGLAFICVTRISHGSVVHDDFGSIVLGTFQEGHSKKTGLLHELFVRSGVPCAIEGDIITARWKKLLWNAPFNPISVLAGGKTTREICDSEPALILVRKVMREVRKLAIASGHPFPENVLQKSLADSFKMKPFKTSMLQDYENRRPMEVEAILGNAVRNARALKVAVPHLETLYALLNLINTR